MDQRAIILVLAALVVLGLIYYSTQSPTTVAAPPAATPATVPATPTTPPPTPPAP